MGASTSTENAASEPPAPRTLESADGQRSEPETIRLEPGALATLQAAKTSDPMLAEVIRQRTAELLISAGKAEDAVRLLGKPTTPAALEVLGVDTEEVAADES